MIWLTKQAIMHTVEYGKMAEEIYLGPSESYFLTTTNLLMGDVNGDNLIDDLDASLVSSSTASSSLTQYEFLAADVDMDGNISSKDALMVMKYSAGTIESFWPTDSIVPLTNSSWITDGGNHTFYNKTSQSYLLAYKLYDVVFMGSPNNIQSKNFLVQGTGPFTLQNRFSGNYVAVGVDQNNQPGSLYYSLMSNVPAAQWHIVNFGENYYLVNSLFPNRLLTKDLELTRCLYDARWDVQPQTVTIDYFYNYGYRHRVWTELNNKENVTESSYVVDANVITHLMDCQSKIDAVLTKTFKLNVIMNTPELIVSREDLCYVPNINPTFSQLVNAIGDTQIADDVNDNACIHSDSDDSCLKGTNPHHRSASAGLDYMIQERSTRSEEDHIYLLTSGYQPCSIKGIDNNNDGVYEEYEHRYGAISGLANSTQGVCGVYHASRGNTYKNNLTALHEICHCLGAGGKADTEHGQCVMSYNCNEQNLLITMNSVNPSDYRDLFCDACYNAIVSHLND